MARKASKKIVIIAGPNGAGKTTFAREFLPNEAECPVFVNADLIAAGLAPFDPARVALRAGRLMLEEIYTHVRKGGSFAFETTLRETPIYSFFSWERERPARSLRARCPRSRLGACQFFGAKEK